MTEEASRKGRPAHFAGHATPTAGAGGTSKARPVAALALMWVCIALCVAFMVSLRSQDKVSDTSIEDMSAALLQVADTSLMQQGDNSAVKRLYGIDPNEYDGYLLYYPASNASADELFVLKLKDTSQRQQALPLVQARQSAQLKAFDGYGTDQYEMLQASVIDSCGNYILFAASDNAQAIDSAFTEAL